VKIEHVALNVPDPPAMAGWYADNLGMRIVRSSGAPAFGHFVADSSGSVLIEIYRNTDAPVPDYAATNPATFHLAFVSEDVRAERDRLVSAGAALVTDAPEPPAGDVDEFVMIRDPWGVPIQLAKRAESMV
jgi:glyoxylase I family protein